MLIFCHPFSILQIKIVLRRFLFFKVWCIQNTFYQIYNPDNIFCICSKSFWLTCKGSELTKPFSSLPSNFWTQMLVYICNIFWTLDEGFLWLALADAADSWNTESIHYVALEDHTQKSETRTFLVLGCNLYRQFLLKLWLIMSGITENQSKKI